MIKTLNQALLSCTSESQIHEFLADLLTPAELTEFEQRRLIAQKLHQWIPYKQIESEHNTSSTTIARVAKCLNRENSGYQQIIDLSKEIKNKDRIFLGSSTRRVLDKFISRYNITPSDMNVGFVSTGANLYEDQSRVSRSTNKLTELGFNIIEIDIAWKTQSELHTICRDLDIIYVNGGNSFYLLDQVKKTWFDTIIKNHINNGGYYIGSSAGTIILGPNIEPLKIMDRPDQVPHITDFDGLHIINKIIIPHHDSEKYADKVQQIMKTHAHQSDVLFPLGDMEAAIRKDNKLQII